jgi:transcriptional regulator with XRE-family HTH domain
MEPKATNWRELDMVWSPDVKGFIQWRKFLKVTPAEVARRAEVSSAHVCNIEKGKKPFSEPARTKLWKALHAIYTEQMEKLEATTPAEQTPEQKEASEFYRNYMNTVFSWYETPQQRAERQSEFIKKQNELIEAQGSEIKRLNTVLELVTKQIDWPAIVARMEKLETDYADVCRLNGLRTEAIIATEKADAVQAEIEQRVKKDKDA